MTGGLDFPIWVRPDQDRKTFELFTFIRKVFATAEGLAMLRAMLAQTAPKETVQAVDMISA